MLFSQNTDMLSQTASSTPPSEITFSAVEKVHNPPAKTTSKKQTKPKKVMEKRLSQSEPTLCMTKPTQASSSSITSSQKVSNPNRRSTFDFVENTNVKRRGKKGKATTNGNGKPNIVCTSCQAEDVEVLNHLVKSLKGYELAQKVNSETTHVVFGDNRRTLNALRGMLRGCWIVSKEWLYKCLEQQTWVEEDSFERTDFSPHVRTHRLERASFGPVWTNASVFQDCDPIFFNRTCKAKREDLEELALLGGTKAVSSARNAKIIVMGEGDRSTSRRRGHDVFYIQERWFFDCIHQNKLLDTQGYLIK